MASKLLDWWADSRGKVIVILLILWIVALINQFRGVYVGHTLTAVLSVVGFDLLVGSLRYGNVRFSLSSIVSGLLIGLIFDPASGIVPVFVAAAVATLSKFFLRAQIGKHIFNPAALGIVFASLLFGRPVAWWAASWGMVPAVIVAIGMIPVLFRLRRLWMPVTFLMTYFLVNAMVSPLSAALHLTLDGTVFLFAFIMIPEPMTSVSKGYWRYMWGACVGILVAFAYFFQIKVIDSLLVPLLVANGIGFILLRNKPVTT